MTPKTKFIIKRTIVVIIVIAAFVAGFFSCKNIFTSSSKKTLSSDITSVDHSLIPLEITSTITLDGKKVKFDKKYVSMVSNVVMITEGGNYCIEGFYEDGQIRVFTNNEDVTLILNGVDVRCLNMAPIYAEAADNVTIYVPESSVNSLTCAEIQYYESALEAATHSPESTSDDASTGSSETEDVPVTGKGVIVTECDLAISGGGTLNVFGYLRDGIHSKGSITLEDSTFSLTTTNNGIKASSDIIVESGHFDLASVGDGIQADGNLIVNGGTFNITTGQGSASIEKKTETMPTFDGTGDMPAPPSDAAFEMSGFQPGPPPADANSENSTETENKDKSKKTDKVSRKAIKAENSLIMNDGVLTIDSADDGIHSDGTVEINGGTIEIASSDDAVHADDLLSVKGGKLNITDCCEGIESTIINISGGEVSVISTDDGINASDKRGEPCITISGGKTYVNSEGDGIDSNKDLVITGGEIYVDGPSNPGNGSIDVGTEDGGIFVINKGTITAIGMSGMLEVPHESSTQQSLTYVFDEPVSKGSIVTLLDGSGKLVSQFALIKDADSIIYSSPDLVSGETYTFTCEEAEGTLEASEINATNHEGGFGFGFGPGPGPAPGEAPDFGADSASNSDTGKAN
ncbi:carbohydrate-binding domain-containing protein [Butyrivibrio sp. X503]|uniref:carbohydrate-binding domain-containing protein n=1 Tax=Butyrivibrio sp. X503 TaxID=2364878 RepID=UPI000EA9A92A|nr:carbohydrate-binding domain-containing protein [Butyrivibrio sp. X503]RKM54314.1 carbohydrate-binding domain-containing protein [Butyrivibrio sp. X503]